MAEVARMWTGLLNDIRSLTHKDASSIAEIEQGVQAQQPKSGVDHQEYHDLCEQVLSPRIGSETVKRGTPSLSRRGSPLPSAFSSEIQAHTKHLHNSSTISKSSAEEIIEFIHKITPVVEFIEHYRNLLQSRKRRAKTHRRRNSEPMNVVKPRERTSRSTRISTENIGSPQTQARNLDNSGTMGKSPSLRDIFTIKKGNNNSGFFSKPSQFVTHLRAQQPSLQEIQRLHHTLESKQVAFMQRFVEKGGAKALFAIMSSCSRRKTPTQDDINVSTACCACIFALLNACEEYSDISEKMAVAVSALLADEMPQSPDHLLPTYENQIVNISTICGHTVGHRFIIQEMRKRCDFALLVALLRTDLSVEGDTRRENMRIKVAILTLIAKLIQNVEEPEQRFLLTNTFLNLKLFPILMDVWRMEFPELRTVVTELEEIVLKDYFLMLPRAKNNNKFEPQKISVRIPIFNVIHATIQVPYDTTRSTVAEVISYVYEHVSYLLQFDEKAYGIFLNDEADITTSKEDTDDSAPGSPTQHSAMSSLRSSRDDIAFSLASSGEFAEEDLEDMEAKAKSPRLNKRRSYHKPIETVVINPLYGKTNPILKQPRNRRLSIYTSRVLTLNNDEGDESEFVTSKNGEWLQGVAKVSAVRYEGWDFKLKPWSLLISWKRRQIPVEVDPDSTTFSDVVGKVLMRLSKHEEDRIFEYNLVIFKLLNQDDAPEAVWLEPSKYVSSLPPRVRELELRTRPIPLSIRSKDSTTHAVLVTDATTIQQVIKEFGSKLGLHGRHLQDYGLYDSITDDWLETGDVLTVLQREKYDLHFLLRPRSIRVIYQIHDCDFSNIAVTRKDRLTGNFSNIPLYESPSQNNLIPQGSPILDAIDEETTSGLQVEPHSFSSEDLLVHFTLCVSQVLISTCKTLGLKSEDYTMFKETADASVVELTPWKSLRNQGVAPNSHVWLLRSIDKEETGNDVNIWDESQTENLKIEEGPDKRKQVIAGTLNQLVRVLTSETEHDVFFLESFMLTYRSFTDHKTLLRKLGERYTTPPNIDPVVAKTIKSQVCIVLKYWITHEDLADKEVILDEIAKFVDSIVDEFSDLVVRLEKFIQAERDRLNAPIPDFIPQIDENSRLSPSLFILNFAELDEATVAGQITLQDSERFSKLRTNEFFNQAWLRNNAPNLGAMVAHFNSLSSAVSTSIVTERLIKKRVKIVEKHITIAMHLRKLNDFFALQAFICGINCSAVNRLKYTMERISSQHAQTLGELQRLMSMENSYKNYRQAFKEAKPPCIPYIGAYMTDLTFIDEGNSDNYGNLINFHKRTLVSKILMEIETHRAFKYQIQSMKKIDQFINAMPRWNESELYAASLECEPRGASKSSIK